jgi:hypothetical protein
MNRGESSESRQGRGEGTRRSEAIEIFDSIDSFKKYDYGCLCTSDHYVADCVAGCRASLAGAHLVVRLSRVGSMGRGHMEFAQFTACA